MQIDRKKRTIVNTATGIIYRLLSVLLPFVVNSAIINTLGIEYIGVSGLAKVACKSRKC
jgi:hypothetical protein